MTWQRKRLGPSLPLLIDYQPARSLDIWYKNQKQKILALSSKDPLRGEIAASCFLATSKELLLLQTALVRFVRFAIWSGLERLNTLKDQQDQSRTIESFVEYLLGGTKTIKRGKGIEVQFGIGIAESRVLLCLLHGDTQREGFIDHETKLVRKMRRGQWGV